MIYQVYEDGRPFVTASIIASVNNDLKIIKRLIYIDLLNYYLHIINNARYEIIGDDLTQLIILNGRQLKKLIKLNNKEVLR